LHCDTIKLFSLTARYEHEAGNKQLRELQTSAGVDEAICHLNSYHNERSNQISISKPAIRKTVMFQAPMSPTLFAKEMAQSAVSNITALLVCV